MWRFCLLLAFGLIAACSGGKGDSASNTPAVVETFTMEGASMEPTFKNADRLDVMRYTAPVARGDIIVFHGPTRPDREFIKRVIAAPGQTVLIADGQLKVDGETLSEPYVKGTTECFDRCSFTLPESDEPAIPNPGSSPLSASPGQSQPECETTACYFVLGDNRQNSSDSRQGWLVPVDNIIGYVVEP